MSEGTEQPTEHKLREARKKGDSPHSRDFTAAMATLPWACAFAAGGAWAFAWLCRYVQVLVTVAMGAKPGIPLGWAGLHALMGIAVPLGLGLIATLLPELGQVRGRWASKRQWFDMNRINPASGLKNLFSIAKFTQLGMALIRFAAVGGVAWVISSGLIGVVRHVASGPWYAMYLLAFKTALKILALSSVVCLLLGGVDLFIQTWLWIRRNRMKKDEIKKEHKEQDGDPIIKGLRRQAHQEATR